MEQRKRIQGKYLIVRGSNYNFTIIVGFTIRRFINGCERDQ